MVKKILILGSNGFIGRNLVEKLNNKYNLYAPSSKELNVMDEGAVTRYIKSHQFDVVLNALDLRVDPSTPSSDYVYVVGRLRMFENLAKLSDYYGKMLYFGTGAEYARTLPIQSISEEEFGRAIPSDAYGFLMYTMQMLALGKKNITNFRLFGIFGPHEVYQRRFISNAICKVLCGYPITLRQNAIFDYLYINDLCKMVEYYIENPMKCKAYNATSGKRYELSLLAETVNKTLENGAPILIAKPGYQNEYTASNSLLSSEMGGFEVGSIKDQIGELIVFYSKKINEIDREALLYNH